MELSVKQQLSGLSFYLHTSHHGRTGLLQAQRKKNLTSNLISMGASCSISIVNPETVVVIEDYVLDALEKKNVMRTNSSALVPSQQPSHKPKQAADFLMPNSSSVALSSTYGRSNSSLRVMSSQQQSTQNIFVKRLQLNRRRLQLLSVNKAHESQHNSILDQNQEAFHVNSDEIVSSMADDPHSDEASFIQSLLTEHSRQILTQSQLEQLVLREQIQLASWFEKHDVTGRVKLINQKQRLYRAIILLQIPKNTVGRP